MEKLSNFAYHTPGRKAAIFLEELKPSVVLHSDYFKKEAIYLQHRNDFSFEI
jgi:hypothetical protein